MFRKLIATAFLFTAVYCSAQDWIRQMEEEKNFYTIQKDFETRWQNKAYVKGKGYKQFKRWEWFMEPRVMPTGQFPAPNATWKAWEELQSKYGGAASNSRAGAWSPLGPFSWVNSGYNPGIGRVNVIAEDPNNTQIIYLGAPAGGLWKSIDDGVSWTPLTDDFPTLGVSGIAIDPLNSQIIYISTGDGDGSDTYSNGVLKSSDGGATWVSTGLNWNTTQSRTTRKLLMDPNNSQILFCAASNGLYRTLDGGANWTQQMSGSIRDIEFKPNDVNTVYICTDQFYKSTDGGGTFTLITSGLPGAGDVNRMSVAVTEADPNIVYGLFGKQSDSGFEGLYRSIDAGLTWTQMSSAPNIFGYAANGSDNGGQSWYDMALAADPVNADLIYAGGVNVWKSINGGVSWINTSVWTYPNSTGYTHADIHTLDIYSGKLYCGSDGGIFRSSNQADDWFDLSEGLQISQFYRLGTTPMDPNIIVAGAQDNGSWAAANGTWVHTYGADGMEAAVDPTDPDVMYFSYQNGGLRRSTNGGSSTTGITSGVSGSGAWVTPYVLNPQRSRTLFLGYQDVWKSIDRGSNWTQISSFPGGGTLRTLAVAPSDSNYIYTGTWNTLKVSPDGGANWSDISAGLQGLGISYLAIHPNDPQTVYATLSGFQNGDKVYVSTNAGSSWTNISGNLPNVPANCVAFEEGSQGGLYVGMDIGIFYTDSTLSAWQPFFDGLPNVIVEELEIHYPSAKIRAATFGRGMWESPLYQALNVPPVANFLYADTSSCGGSVLVQFSDASLGAAPGWTWSFPGGTPSTSTAQFPQVAYATAGTYSATLTVSNSVGNSNSTKTFSVVMPELTIDLNVLTDNYPGETTWILEDASGSIIHQGGPYNAQNTQYNESLCVDEGCYTFSIFDSYGDGICCGFGNGAYTVGSSGLGDVSGGGAFLTQESSNICVGSSMQVRVILEGAFDANAGLMRDDLRAMQLVPSTEPYSAAGRTAIGVLPGASVGGNTLFLSGNNAIVDWLWLELDTPGGSSTEATQVALVQRDGDVVAVDGDSMVHFNVLPGGLYRLKVRHRNHLSVGTDYTLSSNAGALVDFTLASTATIGIDAQKSIGTKRALWAGNVVADPLLRYTGSDNDRDPILVAVGGSVPTATLSGYLPEDVNLDGIVKYVGANNDRDPILVNIGGSIPTAVRYDQTP